MRVPLLSPNKSSFLLASPNVNGVLHDLEVVKGEKERVKLMILILENL